MANRFFVNGGVDNNFGTTGNWSATSGGAGGQSVPVSTDDIFFDASSPSCVVDASARAGLSLTCTGFTGTLTFDQNLTITNNITLVAAMTLAGTAILISNNTATITTNGKTINTAFRFNGQNTKTLADNFTITGQLSFTPGSFATTTVNGNTIACGGHLDMNSGAAGGAVSGTTAFVFNGTGTWTGGANVADLRLATTVNTAGTLTLSGVVRASCVFTYTAGTVVTTGSTMTIVTNATFNTGTSITWDNFEQRAGTLTLSSDLHISGTYSHTSASNLTLAGAFTMYVGGSFTFTGGVNGTLDSTNTTIVLNGTGTWSGSSVVRTDLTINTAGTITISGEVRFREKTLKYTAGTLAFVSTPLIRIQASTTILDLADYPMACGIFVDVAGITLRLASALRMASGGTLSLIGTVGAPVVLNSTSGGTPRALTIEPGALIDVIYTNLTDIDCSGGDRLWVIKGTRSNTTNVSAVTPYTSPLGSFVGGGVSLARVFSRY